MTKRPSELVIEQLSDDEKLELIREFEQFERDGQIGDCKLRTLAKTMPEGNNYVVWYMNFLGHECYRYFANKYLEETDAGILPFDYFTKRI